MVTLDRIIMQNFKSFAGKITVPFPKGLTAICGPNGSGKSNIVDALTFVLGTQSAKHIRANKMQNLIFNGAKSRKPADWCEVTLVLDNKDGKVPALEPEISVTRRITRSGLSVYRVGGKTVTKSKALDIIANAGLVPDGHNIIMQGDITRIIEMNPLQRREIIDEISGIAEFNEKRDAALKKLDQVTNRVNEAMAVVNEKASRLEQLKKEKENAEKYQHLNAELRQVMASIVNNNLTSSQEELDRMKVEEKTLSKDMAKADEELQKADSALESKESERREMDKKLFEGRDIDAVRQAERLSAEILRKRDRADMLKEQIAQASAARPESREIKDLPVPATLFSSVLTVPAEYSTAYEIAVAGHGRDLIVDSDSDAIKAIRFLKSKHAGRARFLPLNKMRPRYRREIPKEVANSQGFVGWALDLVKYDQKFYTAISYVLGHTAIVKTIDDARKLIGSGIKVVTLDGDLVEPSGAMVGGWRQRRTGDQQQAWSADALISAREALLEDIKKLEAELGEFRKHEQTQTAETTEALEKRKVIEDSLAELRKARASATQSKFSLQSRLNSINIEHAKTETRLMDLKNRAKEFKDITEYISQPVEELQMRSGRLASQIRSLGLINMRAIEDYQTMSVEFGQIKARLDALLAERDAILKTISEVESKRKERFMETFTDIATGFSKIFGDITGGTGLLRLDDPENIDSGLIIEASPASKKVLDLDVMSGGEKTVTSLAFLFAITQHYASPFYILDEIDAALDKTNTQKIASMLKRYSKATQFLVITHNDITSSAADKVFGVAMDEGASKMFSLALPKG